MFDFIFSLTVEFETEEFGIFRSDIAPLASSPVKLFIEEISLIINLKVLGGSIPRNPIPKIIIPFEAAEAFDWILTEQSLATASGQFRLQNNPSKAVIFLIRGDADSQFANPFELLDNDCSEIQLDLNGKTHTLPVHKKADSGDDVNLYYETFRAMGPLIPVGKWFLDDRSDMFQGMFMVSIDLTRSGMINQLDTLDTDVSK